MRRGREKMHKTCSVPTDEKTLRSKKFITSLFHGDKKSNSSFYSNNDRKTGFRLSKQRNKKGQQIFTRFFVSFQRLGEKKER